MSFTTPWLLALLALLPLLWWLLRATPPAPKRAIFPPLRLLLGLHAPEETPARTPLWLLALRMLAAALLILGLAGPVLHPPRRLAGSGPVLLVIDNGWASAADWGALVAAARRLLARAALDHRPAALLATARGPDDGAPAAEAVPAAQTMAVLKLSIGPALFGLPAANVLGFVEPTRDVRRLSADDALAAVHGLALPVTDVRGRWGLGERPADARIVLVECGQGRIGLWADRVCGTESLSIQPLLPADFHPAELGGAAVSAQGEVVLMLRPEALAAPGNEA